MWTTKLWLFLFIIVVGKLAGTHVACFVVVPSSSWTSSSFSSSSSSSSSSSWHGGTTQRRRSDDSSTKNIIITKSLLANSSFGKETTTTNTNTGIVTEARAAATTTTTTKRITTTVSKSKSYHDDDVSSSSSSSYDVVVVGSGIGGLSCAAMLAKYGYSVAVFESHYAPGGAAHGFTVRHRFVSSSTDSDDDGDGENDNDGEGEAVATATTTTTGDFHFDTGPSFFSGLDPTLPAKTSNPLRTILDAIDEPVECESYSTFGLCFPEGNFVHTPGFGSNRGGVVDQVSGTSGMEQWTKLMTAMQPLEAAVDALPTAALRQDIGAALTTGPYLPAFAALNPLENLKLTGPFSNIIRQAGVSDPFVKNWLDLLCFCLSGLPADGTITAEMALMMGEFYNPNAVMDCPKGGAKSIVQALVRGIEKNGGKIFTNSPVTKIIVQDGKATGIRIKKKGGNSSDQVVIRANQAVVSNLSVWDLYGKDILDSQSLMNKCTVEEKMKTPVGKSFMHLHVGFRASSDELKKLQAHYMYIDDWKRGVEAEDNAVLLSIPSVHDNSLAPEGYAVLHIYTPATEDYDKWNNMDRKSQEYKRLKEERSMYLWHVLEKIIPDIRERTVISQIGTPLTHERFLNRHKGSYGPAIRASDGSFPFPKTSIPGLLVCGDSCFPGIGVPAVAGSGLLTANSVSLDSIKPQIDLLRKMRSKAL